MKKVIGTVVYSVWIKCPYCGLDADLERFYDSIDTELGSALFCGSEKPGKWKNINIEYECPACRKDFALTDLEY